MVLSERAGKPADPSILVDVDALLAAYHDRRPDPSDPAQRVAFGTSGPSRLVVPQRVQRGPHPGDDRGDLPLSGAARLRRAAVPRPRHPRAVRARDRTALERPRRARRRCPRRRGRRLHPDAGRLARHHRRQPAQGQLAPPGRRDRRDAVAQPARRRRVQVQPAQRRPGRHRRHELDPGRGEPHPRGVRVPMASTASRARPTPTSRRASTPYDFLGQLRRRPGQRHRHGRHPRVRAAASASTRWAARRSRTGRAIARPLRARPDGHERAPSIRGSGS